MNKKTLIILFFYLTFLNFPFDIHAKEDRLSNPFKPQFPKEVIPPPVEPPEERIVPTETIVRPPPPPRPQEVPPPQLTITGVVWNSDRPQAIVNGQVVDVGDKISEAEVIAIDNTGITISFQGKDFPIKI